MSSSDKNSSNDASIPQKYVDKILKSQQDQEKIRQDEFALLRQNLIQMNQILVAMTDISQSSGQTAYGKKPIPYQNGSQPVGQLNNPPSDPENYPTIVNIYSINNSRPIEHMTLINDGPGTLFFIVAHSKTDISTQEVTLNVNDQRELFNVYEIRLRANLPLSTFRLAEGVFRTGSTAPQTKINVEIRQTLQSNEIRVEVDELFDNQVPTITITSPSVQTLTPNYIYSGIQPPLPPGQTATLVNVATGLAMPLLVPEGFIIEFFSMYANTSTDCTIRFYIELVPGEFTLFTVLPMSARGLPINLVLNINQFNTQLVDPNGAPPGGRLTLVTVTNDDPFNDLIGDCDIVGTFRRLR